MRKIVVIAALATVAACSKPAPAPAPEATPEAAAPVVVLAADGKSPVGKFKITNSDGTVIMEEDKADGTYVDTDASGKVVETGRWVQKSAEHFCFTKDAPDAKEQCTTEAVDANGVWTAKGESGKTSKVERVES